MSDVAKLSHPTCGPVRVVIDGVEHADINDVRPSEVVGIEAYRMGEFAPGVYAVRGSACGVVVIWTKASARNPQRGKRAGDAAPP